MVLKRPTLPPSLSQVLNALVVHAYSCVGERERERKRERERERERESVCVRERDAETQGSGGDGCCVSLSLPPPAHFPLALRRETCGGERMVTGSKGAGAG
jgi:hypothetical protein